MTRILFWLLAAGWVLSAAPARGDDAAVESSAERFFRAARAAYERGDYSAAALAFEQAYRIAPRGGAAYDAARSWELFGDRARAADDYASALSGGDLNAGNQAVAKSSLATLEPALGAIDVEGPGSAVVFLDGSDRGHLPQHLHLEPGQHRLLVRRSDGSVIERSASLLAGQSLRESFPDFPPPVASVAQPPPETLLATAPPRRMPVWGWVTLGAAGIFTVTGTVTFVSFQQTLDAFNAGDRRSASLRDRAVAYQDATIAAWGLAAAAAAAGTVAWLTSGRSAVSVGWGQVWMSGSF